MAIRMTDTAACLEGDWTITGLTGNLDSMALSLQQIEPGSEKDLQIDCGQIAEADISGLQLLNVWLQCARFRGVKPILVNVPQKLQLAMKVLIGHCLTDTPSDAAVLS